jgi:membrane associated rhomboid family serine protease
MCPCDVIHRRGRPVSSGTSSGGALSSSGRGAMMVHLLVLASLVVHAVRMFVAPLDSLLLDHSRPRLWQLVSSLFMHADVTHLMGNMMML